MDYFKCIGNSLFDRTLEMTHGVKSNIAICIIKLYTNISVP